MPSSMPHHSRPTGPRLTDGTFRVYCGLYEIRLELDPTPGLSDQLLPHLHEEHFQLIWIRERGSLGLMAAGKVIPIKSFAVVAPRTGAVRVLSDHEVRRAFASKGPFRVTRAPGLPHDSLALERAYLALSSISPDHYTLMRERNAEFVAWLARRVHLNKDSYVLEIACGHGWFSDLMANHVDHVYAADLTLPSTIRSTQNFGRVKYFEADVFHFPPLRTRFDLVFVYGLTPAERAQDFRLPDWQRVADTLRQVLRPGGYLYWIQLTDNSGRTRYSGTAANLPVRRLTKDFFCRIGTVERVVTMVNTSFLVRRSEEDRAQADTNSMDIDMYGTTLGAQLKSCVEGMGQALLRIHEGPIALVGPLRLVSLAWFTLKVVCNVSSPVLFTEGVTFTRHKGGLVLRLRKGVGEPEQFLVSGNCDESLAGFEAKFTYIGAPLTVALWIMRSVRLGDGLLSRALAAERFVRGAILRSRSLRRVR